MQGRIIKGIAGFYYVYDVVESVIYECKAKGIFRKEKIKPLVGDLVEYEILDAEEKTGNIIRILPRKNELIRPAVANIDQALVVFAVKKPDPHFNLLDRFLVMMERKEIPVILCFNKTDLAEHPEIAELEEVYASCGYPVLFTSAKKEENIEKLSYYPAASKNHHEYVSGLAYHTYGMLKVAESFCTLYPSLNKDLLYSGITLHDLGKTVELSGPVVPEYTLEGKLLGHISISNAMIKETANKLHIEGEEVTLLQHMILAHHGKNEYGSPVLPQIKEAEILYLIDNIDARMAMMDKALETVEYGKFTKRVFSLENRALYKPKMYEK